jgi:transposase-like protein
MPGRHHTDEEKADAIRLVAERGLAEAWRETGIPKPTLVRWCQDAGVERSNAEQTKAAAGVLRARASETRETLRLLLLEKALDLLERMDEPHVEFKGKDADQVTYPIAPAGAVQNYATSAAILIDKYRLEVGEATGRTESRSLDGLSDHEKEALHDAIRAELARRTERDLHPHVAERAESTAVEEAGST